MILCSSQLSLSTGSGGSYVALDASCTRSARPGSAAGIYRTVQFVGLLNVSLGPPLGLCPPQSPQASFRNLRVQLCRQDYSAEGEAPVTGDETLAYALRIPKSNSTAHFVGRAALTVTPPSVASSASVSPS